MTKKQLLEVAESFGVDVKPTQNKDALMQALDDNYVDYDAYLRMAQIVESEQEIEPLARPSVVPDDATVLLKFVGKNASLEVRGNTYTPRHPFNLVHPDDASYLVEHEGELKGKFVLATPAQAKSFYN